MFISHVESGKAVKSSVYSATTMGIPGFLLRGVFGALWPSNRDLLLITEPCFTDKIRMTIAAFA